MIVALDLEHILASAGHHVVGIAPDTETALEMAPECSLALVDMNLRDGQTGGMIATEIARRHGAKILFVTANPEQIGPARQLAVGHVSKPFNPRSILDAVAAAVEADETGSRFPDRMIAEQAGGRNQQI